MMTEPGVSECVDLSGISTGLGRVLRGPIIVTCMAVEIVSRLQPARHRNTLIKKTFVVLAPFPYLQTSNEEDIAFATRSNMMSRQHDISR